MSAEILRQRITSEIGKKRAELADRVLKFRFVQSSVAGDTFLPHVGAEQVGLSVIDTNAEIRALDNALQIIAEEFKKLISPSQSEGDSKGAQPDTSRGMY